MLKHSYKKTYYDGTVTTDQPSDQSLQLPISLIVKASYLPLHLFVACAKMP